MIEPPCADGRELWWLVAITTYAIALTTACIIHLMHRAADKLEEDS